MRDVFALFLSGFKGPGLNLCDDLWKADGNSIPQSDAFLKLLALFNPEYITNLTLRNKMQFYVELRARSQRLNLQSVFVRSRTLI